MVVPFGVSVGDFIGGIEFICSVIEALEETAGSRAQYRSVIACLQSSDEVLTQLNELDITQEEKEAVAKIVRRYEETTFEFATKLAKYRKSLGDEGTRTWWKSLPRKIQWQRYSDKDVRWYESKLQRHTSALQLLLTKVQCASNTRAHQETTVSLVRIQDTVNSLSQQAAQAASAVTLLSCVKSLQDFLKGILMINIFIVGAMQRIHRAATTLPGRVSMHSEVMFEDAHGCISYINTQFIQSWRAFNFVLQDNFSQKPGWARVRDGKFRLHDRFGRRDLDQTNLFRSIFRPGRHIRMSVLFNWDETTAPTNVCPKCSIEETGTDDTEITCTGCGLWYSRLHHQVLVIPISKPTRMGEEMEKETRNNLRDQRLHSEDLASLSIENTPIEAEQPRDFAFVSITIPSCVHCVTTFTSCEAYRAHCEMNHQLPIKFVDAVGRTFSFPWHLCKSWKGMEELIKQACSTINGIGGYVDQGYYNLSEPDGDIIDILTPGSWEQMIHPDCHVKMQLWPDLAMEDPTPLELELNPIIEATSQASGQRGTHRSRTQMPELSGGFPYECDVCNQYFRRKAERDKHKRSAHSDMSSRRYSCPKEGCYWRFNRPHEVRRHLASSVHISSSSRQFKCRYSDCFNQPSGFPRKDDRDGHEQDKHGAFSRRVKLPTHQT